MYLGGMDKKQVFILEPWKGGEVSNKISIKRMARWRKI